MEASTSKEHDDDDFVKLLEDEIMNYRNSESGGSRPVESQHSDSTECSSSFDGSDCGVEGVDTLSDSEVLSAFCGDNGSVELSKRRKRLSSQWRSFIRPLMWRCKWVELQIRKLDAQAKKYDRKLQVYSQKNPVQSDVLRRRKRREATNDIEAYMSQHNLFSYYEHRKYIREISHNVSKNPSAPQGVDTDAELGNDEILCVGAGDCDKFVEDSLRKIEILHSRVLELKTRSEKVMSEHGLRLSSTDSLSSLDDSTRSPPTTYLMPVGNYIASQLMSEYNFGAALLPGSCVADANRARDHAHLAYASENENEEDILIDNHIVRDELRYFKEVKIRSIQRPSVLKDASQLDRTHSVAQLAETRDDEPRPQASNPTNPATSSRKKRRRN